MLIPRKWTTYSKQGVCQSAMTCTAISSKVSLLASFCLVQILAVLTQNVHGKHSGRLEPGSDFDEQHVSDSFHDQSWERPELIPEHSARYRRQFLPVKQILPIDFLEVPVTPKRNITATTPDPNVSLSIASQGEILKTGDVIDIGSPIKMVIGLDKKSAAIYGIAVQKIVAHGNNKTRYSETFVEDGCARISTIFPDMAQVDRSTVENVFRAFRFPDSSEVRFTATVKVCRQRCPKVKCLPQLSGKSRFPRSVDTERSRQFLSPTNVTGSTNRSLGSIRRAFEYEYVSLISNVTIRGFNPQFILGEELLSERARKRLTSNGTPGIITRPPVITFVPFVLMIVFVQSCFFIIMFMLFDIW